jgi:hypothetical protein
MHERDVDDRGLAVRARLKSAIPTAPAIVLAPCRSKKAGGCVSGSPPTDILYAMPLVAQPQATS